MKIKDVIVEQGVARELWRRATLRPEQKRELEQLETILVRLTKLPLERVQKNSKDILKQYKELLNRNDDWEKDSIGREVALAKAISPYYPDTAAQIITAYSDEKKVINKAQQQPSPGAQAQQPVRAKTITTSAGVQVVSTRPQIHLRYKNQDFFLKTDPSGVETFVNLAGKKVPDQAQEFLMRQLQEL